MKRLVRGLILVVCSTFSIYATDARVISMGTHDAFFLDVINIYRNPASINLFPNMLIGSYGIYERDTIGKTSEEKFSLQRINEDPKRPFFGGILSYSLNQSSEGASQYPMISIAGIFNRHDEMLDRIPQSSANSIYASPVGKIDLMLAYTFINGMTIGAGGYYALQTHYEFEKVQSSLYKANVGLNWPVTNTIDLQLNGGLASFTAVGTDSNGVEIAGGSKNDLSFRGELRLFSAMATMNGDIVPHAAFEKNSFRQGKVEELNINGGLGLNLNIDKGFFWCALEGIYTQKDSTVNISGLGGRVSGGIERNLVWDWLVWRVGFIKELIYVTETSSASGVWMQNPENDTSDRDHVHFGFGINLDNRFRADGVVAEDIFYTFTNLISGPQHHVMNRITATYSF